MALSLVRLHLKTKKKPSKINTNTTEDNDFPIFKTVFNYHIIGLSNEANNFFLAQLTQKFEVSNLSEFFETSPGPSNSQVEIENEEQKEKNKSVLTLTEFLETKSSNITDNQFVEVS